MVAAYVQREAPSAERVEVARVRGMPAGASTEPLALDLAVECDGERFELPVVIRPQRTEGILAPYDIGRQFRVMRALARTAVPVPAVFWHEPSGEVLGAPFFMMERVAGETMPLFWYGGQSPRLEACARALGLVHGVDWRTAGLEFLGDARGGAIESELGEWRRRAAAAGLENHPLLVKLGGWLVANAPGDTEMVLLHGDPNAGNYLLRGDEVVAVLDWELAALGDRRSDLGFYAALLTVFGAWPGERGETLLSEVYQRVTGVELGDLGYFEALGLYKMAVVLAGWSRRGNGWGGFYGFSTIEQRLDVLLGPRWGG